MNITDKNIDGGKALDWRKTSAAYTKFRDIYPIFIHDSYNEKFELIYHEEYPLYIHFTRESWHGRMKACRGIDTSLTEEEISMLEQELKYYNNGVARMVESCCVQIFSLPAA